MNRKNQKNRELAALSLDERDDVPFAYPREANYGARSAAFSGRPSRWRQNVKRGAPSALCVPGLRAPPPWTGSLSLDNLWRMGSGNLKRNNTGRKKKAQMPSDARIGKPRPKDSAQKHAMKALKKGGLTVCFCAVKSLLREETIASSGFFSTYLPMG